MTNNYEVLKEHEINLIKEYENKKVQVIEDQKDKIERLLNELLNREEEANERIQQLQDKDQEL